MKQSAISFPKLSVVVYSIIVYGLKIIGLAPFSYRRSLTCGYNDVGSVSTKPFAHSRMGSIYNLLLTIPLSAGVVTNFFNAVGAAPDEASISNYINNGVYMSRRLVGLGSAFLILMVWSFRQKKTTAALNLFHEISARLSALKQQPVNQWVVVSYTIQIIITAVLWISVSIYAVTYTSLRSFLISTSKFFPSIIIFWFAIEYSMLMEFVARKFRALNNCLANYHELNYSSRSRVRINTQIIYRNDRLASIRLLRSLRMSLVELCDDIADFFSLPILFVILYLFCAFVIDLYNIFIFTYQPNKLYSRLLSASPFVWFLVIIGGFVYPVVALTLNVTRAKREAELTGRIINRLSFAARDGSEIQLELQHFSRELQNDNVDVFSACGFFSLDTTLLPSILASTATYFVVFLQFRSPGCEPDPSGN